MVKQLRQVVVMYSMVLVLCAAGDVEEHGLKNYTVALGREMELPGARKD